MPEPVALEDAVEGAVWEVEHWREIVWPMPAWKRQAYLKQHLAPWPQLQNAILIVLPALQATERDWPRRRYRAAEELLAALCGEDQRTVHRWRGAFDNFERRDLRLATCEDCGRDICRRRSEPSAARMCGLCHHRRMWTYHLRLEGWLTVAGELSY